MRIMKKRNLLLGILIILTFKIYSQDIEIALDEPIELTSFEQFFKKDNSLVPLDTLNYSMNKSFSPDKSQYLKNFRKEKKYHLMTYDDSFIIEVPYTSLYDKIVWLQNCLIVVGTNPESPRNSSIYLISFNDKKLSTFNVKGIFGYMGHSDSLCYFYSFTDSIYLGDHIIPNKNTIFSINEKGLLLTNIKKRDDNNKKIITYYNESFSVVMEKDSSSNWNYNFYHYGLKWTFNKPIIFFQDNDVYYRNGITYVIINTKAIYRFDKNSVTKIADCDTLSIRQFMVDNNYLIYSLNYDSQKPPLGIFNLETKETFHPIILQKKD